MDPSLYREAAMLNRVIAAFAVVSAMNYMGLCSSCAVAQTSVVAAAATQCNALAGADFSQVQDAPTQLTAAKLIGADSGNSAYCQIQGYVAPQVGFELRLPTGNWNGKFMEVGCGGWCGSINADACDVPLQHGYACIATDMSHKGRGEDLLWADNNLQAQINFGYRATHVAALSGKAIAERYYGKAPARSYFVGCSTGGYQGVMEAQRFPWDFDGIIAGAPNIDEAAANLRAAWIARTFLDRAGKPLLSHESLRLVHDAALAKCDMDDGVKDGIIGNPLACKFDPRKLICKVGKTSNCLAPIQAEIVRHLYAGPMTSSGEKTSTGGFLPGSELLWEKFWPASSMEQYFKYATWGWSADRGWKYTDFDFDRDYKRFGLAWYDNSNPDLHKFKSAGGKLIVYHGGTDTVDLPGAVTNYYETVERTIGGSASTKDFFRLFLIPGMNHCSGGAGAYTIDYLSYLEDLVEQGKAPDAMLSSHVSDMWLASQRLPEKWMQLAEAMGMTLTPEIRAEMAASDLRLPLDATIPVAFTRPVYPYPIRAKYKGAGDPNDAANFVPIEDR
jgi:hypothetical protein